VIEGQAALVAPVDVDLPPVDLAAPVVGQALVGPPGRVASGRGEGEAVVWSAVERLDDALGEFAGHVVDHYQFAVQLSLPIEAPGHRHQAATNGQSGLPPWWPGTS